MRPGLFEVILVLLMFLGPALKGVFEYLAEQKKKQGAKKAGGKTIRAAQENNEGIVLAEAVEMAYDSESLEVLELLDEVSVKRKKTPKIRAKPNRKKTAELLAVPPVAQSVLAAAIEPELSEVSRPQLSPLAVELFKMFQSPAGVQQAVLAGEILKRPSF